MEEDADLFRSFEQISNKYEEQIFNLILRLVGDRDTAEDLTVETFVNAWRHWDQFRGEVRVSTWLHQIAVNNCKNRFRLRDKRRSQGKDWDWQNASEKAVRDAERTERVRRAVDALPPEYRTVLILAQNEDLTYEEIAQITGLSVPAVKTRLHRARSKVRQQLSIAPADAFQLRGGGAVRERFISDQVLETDYPNRVVLGDSSRGIISQTRLEDGSYVLILDERRWNQTVIEQRERWITAFVFDDTDASIRVLEQVKMALLGYIDDDGANGGGVPALTSPVRPSPASGITRTIEEAEEPPRNP